MKSRHLFAATFGTALFISLVAHAKLARTGDPASVTFTATGPAGLSIVGTTSDLSVADTDADFTVTVPLKNLDTKIELRNKHMREKYLETDKFPNAELKVAKSELSQRNGTAKANGTLTLHGKSQKAQFSYTAKPDGAKTNITGTVHVNMKDYDITQPGYAGISVKPDVDIAVSFVLQDK